MSPVSFIDTMFQVFISKKTTKDVAELFQLLVKNIGSYEKRRECFDIDYHLLGKGYLWETRFVLGKVILETMRYGTLQRGGENAGEENNCIHTEISEETLNMELSDVVNEQMQVKKDRKHSFSLCSPEVKEQSTKKRKLVVSKCSISERDMTLEKQGMVERGMCQKRAKKHQNIDGTDELAREGLISLLGDMSEKRCQLPDDKAIEKKKGDVKNKKRQQKDRRPSMVVEKKHHMLQEHKVPEQHDVVRTKKEAKLEQVGKETGRRLLLSDLFK